MRVLAQSLSSSSMVHFGSWQPAPEIFQTYHLRNCLSMFPFVLCFELLLAALRPISWVSIDCTLITASCGLGIIYLLYMLTAVLCVTPGSIACGPSVDCLLCLIVTWECHPAQRCSCVASPAFMHCVTWGCFLHRNF